MARQSIYLITPRIDDPQAFALQLESALSTGDVGCVLLRLVATDESAIKRHVKMLATIVRQAGAALVIEGGGDSRLAAHVGADGVHITGLAGLAEAQSSLKPDRIVGVGGLKSRHDCMEAGEMDADYLLFGEPKPDGYVPPLEQTVERCQWWAEVFQLPCVGYADKLTDVAAIAEARVEFVALGDAIWSHPGGPAAAIAQAKVALGPLID